MKKENQDKKSFSFISLLASLFVYIGAIAIYFYANGWRIGNMDDFFIKTGVLTVVSDPFLATLYVDGEQKGRTPKSVSLPIGLYDISLYRSDYREWKKTIEIKDEKSTPVYPWLILEDIQKKQPYLLEDIQYIDSWESKNGNYTYLLTSKVDTTSLQYTYSIYRFDLNTAFWDLSSNPTRVLSFESEMQTEVDLLLSPDGTLGLLSIIESDNISCYLLDSSRYSTLETSTALNIKAFTNYEVSWSNDNNYLIFESDSDLISFDIAKQTRYLLLKESSSNKSIWNTDEQGFFYKISPNEDSTSENTYSYLLSQEEMDGSSQRVLIDDLYFQKDTEYIKRYREDTGTGKYGPFTNSPESTKSVGAIKAFSVDQDTKGIYILTETSSYWYNMDTGKYHLVSPYPSNFIEISPDNYKFLFKDTLGYFVFTFEKEDGDHTNQIGAKQIDALNGKDVSDISWLSNSSYVSYIKEGQIYISDKDGDNEMKILEIPESLIYFDIKDSDEELIVMSLENNDILDTETITIDSYRIH